MNKQLLPTVKDRMGILYLDKASIYQNNFAVVFKTEEKEFNLPVANLISLILGPGTSITHSAIKQITEYGCSIIFSGEDLHYFYCFGVPLTNSSKNILIQSKFLESKVLHLEVVRRMYEIRYPDLKLKSKTLEELRGIEGLRVAKLYKELALSNNIEWIERTYHLESFDSQDEINKAITSANQLLYSIVSSVINSLGFSTAIGYIHTGNMFSFSYDIADLYKEKFILPVVFEYIGKYGIYNSKDIRNLIYNQLIENDIVRLILSDLKVIFNLENF